MAKGVGARVRKWFGNRWGLAGMAVLAVALLLVGHHFATQRRTESLRGWVEDQNFVFLVPAQEGFLPGDIVQWPEAKAGAAPSGHYLIFEKSIDVLGEDGGSLFTQTGPYNVTLSGSVDAALRAGALTSDAAASAKAAGAEEFELVMKDVMIIEAPLGRLQRAIAGNASLVRDLRDPNRTVVHRILRPGSFHYRFAASGSTGFSGSLKRLVGMKAEEPDMSAGGKYKVGMTIDSERPLVIGIAMAKLDLSPAAAGQPAEARVRPLEFDESRTLQTDPNAALWPAGSTLRVRFMEGSEAQKALFRDAMGEWLKYANLKVAYVESGRADLRVKFSPEREGWSYVGTTSLRVDPNDPTIVIGFPAGARGARGAYLHEIGHALGLVHEFQNPAARGIWKPDAAYAYFERNYGWPRDIVHQMLFSDQPYPGARPVDSSSVMTYLLPGHLFRNGKGFTPGDDLSGGDRAYIAQLYPRDGG